jgi:hypothetical protein
MTDTERDRRWSMAQEHYRAGGLCFDNHLFGASTTRSYYAAYQGMWVALSDPPTGTLAPSWLDTTVLLWAADRATITTDNAGILSAATMHVV